MFNLCRDLPRLKTAKKPGPGLDGALSIPVHGPLKKPAILLPHQGLLIYVGVGCRSSPLVGIIRSVFLFLIHSAFFFSSGL